MQRHPWQSLVLWILSSTWFATLALAASGAEDPLKTRRVALFKNGLAYFTASATLPAKATTLAFSEIPPTAHGTLWIDLPADLPLKGLFTRRAAEQQTFAAASLSELLEANVGRSVVLGPMDIRGQIISATSALVLLDTADGTVAIDPSTVQRIDAADDTLATGRSEEATRTVLQLELERPAPDAEINVSYLRKGMTWAPSYQVDLSRDDTARFVAQAALINDAEDLDDVEIHLVTGFPNFRFADTPSPLSPDLSLREFLANLTSAPSSSLYASGALTQQVVVNTVSSTHLDDYLAATDGLGTEDLSLFPLPPLSLKRGERALLTLFAADLPYEEIYTWSIPDTMTAPKASYGRPSPENLAPEVWHTVRLSNTSTHPLTTAPVTFVSDGQIVGQDTLTFTGTGAKTSVRVNRALGLKAEARETEVSRETETVRLYGRSYHRVTARGELHLTNRLGKTARVDISKSLSGDILSTSETPETTLTTEGLQQANASQRLRWTFDLEAGEKKVLHYEYRVLIQL